MRIRSWTLIPLALTLLLLVALPPPAARVLPAGRMTVRVHYRDAAQLAELRRQAGEVWDLDPAARTLSLATSVAGIEQLTAAGYTVDVLRNDDRQIPACYRAVVQLYADAQAFENQYPNLVQRNDYGDSWDKVASGGLGGYDLYALRLTNEAIPGPKPRFFTDGGIHARELATPELVMEFAEYLLTNYGVNPDVTALLDYSEIHIGVNTNPDGHSMNEQYTDSWRKNTNTYGCTYPDYGVDLNRNQDFKWGCCGGSSSNPCDETYRGTAPASEPEIAGYETYVRSLFPDQRGPADGDVAPITTTGFLINYHSVAAEMLYPWGWTTTPSPNATDLRGIAVKYTSVNNRYAVSTALYTVDGNTRDWGYGELGIPAYVVELGDYAFYEPCDNLPNVIADNMAALFYMTKLADMPYLRIHGPQTNDGVQVHVAGTQATITATVNFSWTGCTPASPCNNPFAQNVGAAELYLDVPPDRGLPATPIAMVPEDGSFNSPTEVVRATVDVAGLPPGRHLAFLRGRGLNPYQGYQTWGPVTAAFVDVNVQMQYWEYAPLQMLNVSQR